MDSFEILLNMTGISTPSGVEIVKEVKEVVIIGGHWPEVAKVILTDGWIFVLGFHSLFKLQAELSTASSLVTFGSNSFMYGDEGYWREFREAVKEVALIYEN